jgi:hypothetical protein
MMKMNELPNNSNGQSIQLDAKGKSILLEYFPDGDIYFWTDDGVCLEFDRKNTSLIIAALRQQEKLPKGARFSPPTLVRAPQPLRTTFAVKPLSVGAETTTIRQKEPNRAVAKEEQGWGATVYVDGRPVRYYYDKRDSARAASPSHQVGEAGRVG